MPSPVGHALAGLAAGWLVDRAPWASHPGGLRRAGAFALLGMLPDADLLVGAHSGPTHGVGAALIAGLVAAGVSPAKGRLRLALACAAAYGSHILLDWLGTDTSAPIGIMALWPFATGYYEASLHLFPAVSRRYWQPELFWSQNLRALVTELLILGPVLVAMWISRRRLRQNSLGGELTDR